MACWQRGKAGTSASLLVVCAAALVSGGQWGAGSVGEAREARRCSLCKMLSPVLKGKGGVGRRGSFLGKGEIGRGERLLMFCYDLNISGSPYVCMFNKNCTYLRCTTWGFYINTHSEMITTVKLLNISSRHMVTIWCVCVVSAQNVFS